MRDRLSVVGSVSAILFGAWTLYELVGQPPEMATTATTEDPMETSVELPELDFIPPELEDLRITLDRPLFNASRRPEELVSETELPTQSQPETVDAPPLGLSAVIVDEQGRSALLEPVETRVVQRVQEGENIAGWRLVEVREDAVVLAVGDNRAELALRVFDAPPPKHARRIGRNKNPSRKPGRVRPKAQATARAERPRAARFEQARRDRQ